MNELLHAGANNEKLPTRDTMKEMHSSQEGQARGQEMMPGHQIRVALRGSGKEIKSHRYEESVGVVITTQKNSGSHRDL